MKLRVICWAPAVFFLQAQSPITALLFAQDYLPIPALASLFQHLPREHLLPTQRCVKAVDRERQDDGNRKHSWTRIPRETEYDRKTIQHRSREEAKHHCYKPKTDSQKNQYCR